MVASAWITEHQGTVTDAESWYGPLTVPGGTKATRVQVRGAVSFEASTASSTSQLKNDLVHGVQYGLSGYTPVTIETSSFPPSQWLRVESMVPSTGFAIWTPTTADANFLDRYLIRYDWHGQLPIADDTDFYYDIGAYSSLDFMYGFFGSVQVWYS